MSKVSALLVFLALGCGDDVRPANDGGPTPDVPTSDTGFDAAVDAAPMDASRDALVDARTRDAAGDAMVSDASPDSGTEACPPHVTCVTRFPFVHSDSTATSSRSDIARYDCAPDVDESGPERWYRVDVPHDGFLALSLSELGEGVDVDVHLLEESESCVDRGHWRAGAFVEAGRYWAVVDSWVDGVPLSGAYTLNAGLTSVDDFVTAGVERSVAERAMRVFSRAWELGETDRLEYAIIDFSLHSVQPREWIFDLATGEHLWTLFVSHGMGSSDPADPGLATTFSNIPESHQSSLGLLRTGELYVGDFGPSHRLDGLEPGINDNVRSRDIVMHPWNGSRQEFIDEWGYTQPTWGCPSIDDRLADEVRQVMANGALMWFWAPDPAFVGASEYL
ncbi:MAG: murein L,D-transpeptidase catalytic domain family protein [Polyangiales bacterium]